MSMIWSPGFVDKSGRKAFEKAPKLEMNTEPEEITLYAEQLGYCASDVLVLTESQKKVVKRLLKRVMNRE